MVFSFGKIEMYPQSGHEAGRETGSEERICRQGRGPNRQGVFSFFLAGAAVKAWGDLATLDGI